jgi:hypothetical protein
VSFVTTGGSMLWSRTNRKYVYCLSQVIIISNN